MRRFSNRPIRRPIPTTYNCSSIAFLNCSRPGGSGGGWSLSPDAATSVQAADELTKDYAQGLLGVHADLAASDLADSDVVYSLEARVKEQRGALCRRRDELEERIRSYPKRHARALQVRHGVDRRLAQVVEHPRTMIAGELRCSLYESTLAVVACQAVEARSTAI